MMFEQVSSFSIDLTAKEWKSSITTYLESRSETQEEKKSCNVDLKTCMGHPSVHAELQVLQDRATATNEKMLHLLTERSEKLEGLTTDFVARIIFLSILLSDLLKNLVRKCKNGIGTYVSVFG